MTVKQSIQFGHHWKEGWDLDSKSNMKIILIYKELLLLLRLRFLIEFQKAIFISKSWKSKSFLFKIPAPRHGPELDYRLNCDLRVAGKRRRRRKRSDPSKNASKSQPASQSSTSSVSGGSKRSSVVSDSNDSNLDSSSLGILSPTEIHSNW